MSLRVFPLLATFLLPLSAAAGDGVGVLAGRVSFTGAAPEPKVVSKQSDPVCAKTPGKDESLVVGAGGGIGNVVVALPPGTKGSGRPFGPAVIDQKGCRYTPRVVLVRRGDRVKIKNSDRTIHNIHAYDKSETLFNEAQTMGGPELVKDTDVEPGSVITLKCDVHPWMEAFLYVTNHSFARVTDGAGRFKIERVPAGRHQLEVWHPVLGKKVVDAVVRAGKTTNLNITLGMP